MRTDPPTADEHLVGTYRAPSLLINPESPIEPRDESSQSDTEEWPLEIPPVVEYDDRRWVELRCPICYRNAMRSGKWFRGTKGFILHLKKKHAEVEGIMSLAEKEESVKYKTIDGATVEKWRADGFDGEIIEKRKWEKKIFRTDQDFLQQFRARMIPQGRSLECIAVSTIPTK